MAGDGTTPWTPLPGAPLAIVRARHGWMAYNPHDLYIGKSIERYGEFGEHELDVMRTVTPADGVVFDVGANSGTHAVAMARHVGSNGMVFAFEPQRVVHGILATNATLNALNWIHPAHAAVGAAPGTILIPDFVYENEGNYGAIAPLAGRTRLAGTRGDARRVPLGAALRSGEDRRRGDGTPGPRRRAQVHRAVPSGAVRRTCSASRANANNPSPVSPRCWTPRRHRRSRSRRISIVAASGYGRSPPTRPV